MRINCTRFSAVSFKSILFVLGIGAGVVSHALPVAVLKDTQFTGGFWSDPSANGCKDTATAICGYPDPNDLRSADPNLNDNKIYWSSQGGTSTASPVWNLYQIGTIGSLTDNYGLPLKSVDCNASDGSCTIYSYVRDIRAAPQSNNSYINYPNLYSSDGQTRPPLLMATQDASGIPLDGSGRVPVDVTKSTCPNQTLAPYVRCLADGYTQTAYAVGRVVSGVINETQSEEVTASVVNPKDDTSGTPTSGLDTTTNPQPLIYGGLYVPAGGGSLTVTTNAFNEYYMRDIFGKGVVAGAGNTTSTCDPANAKYDLNCFIYQFYDGPTTSVGNPSSRAMIYFHDGTKSDALNPGHDVNGGTDIYGDTSMVANWENLVGQGGTSAGQAGWRHNYIGQTITTGPASTNALYPVAGLRRLNFHLNQQVTENRYTPCDLGGIYSSNSNADGCAKLAGWGMQVLEFGFYNPVTGTWLYLHVDGLDEGNSSYDPWGGCTYKNWQDNSGDGVFGIGDSIPTSIAANTNQNTAHDGNNSYRNIYEMSDVVLGTDMPTSGSTALPRYWTCNPYAPSIPLYKASKGLRSLIPHIGEPYATASQTGLVELPLVDQVHWASLYPPSGSTSQHGVIYPGTYPLLTNAYQWDNSVSPMLAKQQPANQYSAYTLNPNPTLGTTFEANNGDASSTVFSGLLTSNNLGSGQVSTTTHITSQTGNVEYQINLIPYLTQMVNAINQYTVADLINNHGCGASGDPSQSVCTSFIPLKVDDFTLNEILLSQQETATLAVYKTTYSGLSLNAVNSHNDFTGDGNADILVRDIVTPVHAGQGAWTLYPVSNNVVSGSGGIGGSTEMDIQYQATLDTSGDGTDDILVRSVSTGAWYLYPIVNGVKTGVVMLTSIPANLYWQFAAAGDFNGDGMDDVLLRCMNVGGCDAQTSYGQYRAFYFDLDATNDNLTTTSIFPHNVASIDLISVVPLAAADLNGDGVDDLITQNISTHNYYVTNPVSGVTTQLSDLPSTSDWLFQFAADLNQDGIADVMLRSKSTGVWQLYEYGNNMKAIGGSPLTVALPTASTVKFAYVGDYDGDGNNDVVYTQPNGSTFDVYAATLQNASFQGSISGNILTAYSWSRGTIQNGQALTGMHIPNGLTITSLVLANGTIAQYQLSASVASVLRESMWSGVTVETPVLLTTLGTNSTPLTVDSDGDGLTNAQEISLGTNLNLVDSDGDGLTDGQEVNTYLTNPLVTDTDGDGLSDGYEVNTTQTNPIVAMGTLDTSFNPVSGSNNGANNTVNAVVVDSNGYVVIGGSFTSILGDTTRKYIARLKPDGSLDTTFTPPAISGGVVNALAIQTDGKIFIGGTFTSVTGGAQKYFARLNSNGSLDTAYTPPAITGTAINAINFIYNNSDNPVIIAGAFTKVGNTTQNNIARLSTNDAGILKSSFNPNPNGAVSVVVTKSASQIYIGGAFTKVGSTTENRIAAVDIGTGALDAIFNPGATVSNNTVKSIATQSSGKIIIGGTFTSVGGATHNGIARLGTNGLIDGTFNTSGSGIWPTTGSVNALYIQADDSIIVGGSFSSVLGTARNNIAEVDSNGATVRSLNSNANGVVNTFGLQANGKLVIGGAFTSVSGTTRNRVAQIYR